MLFGVDMSFRLFDDGVLLALLPPGAFIGLGLLVALKNAIDSRMTAKQSELAHSAEAATQPV